LPSRLTPFQERVLELLAGIDPPWTLTGGGALVGLHLGHRATRDLDLFWHGQAELGALRAEAAGRLRAAGLAVESVHGGPSFERMRVTEGDETLLVDLVAEPVATIERPVAARVGSADILIDTPHEILVNKLCALLDRSELRDLQDVRELLAREGDLERALADAPRKNSGFSPLTVAWLLREMPVPSMAAAASLGEADQRELEVFRDELVSRITRAAGAREGP